MCLIPDYNTVLLIISIAKNYNMNEENTTPNYWAFKHKPGEGGEFECRPYVKMALENKCVN